MKNRRERLIYFCRLIVSLTLIIGILLGNWITGIRIRGIVSDELSNQRFSILPGNNAGSGFSLTPKGNKIIRPFSIFSVNTWIPSACRQTERIGNTCTGGQPGSAFHLYPCQRISAFLGTPDGEFQRNRSLLQYDRRHGGHYQYHTQRSVRNGGHHGRATGSLWSMIRWWPA